MIESTVGALARHFRRHLTGESRESTERYPERLGRSGYRLFGISGNRVSWFARGGTHSHPSEPCEKETGDRERGECGDERNEPDPPGQEIQTQSDQGGQGDAESKRQCRSFDAVDTRSSVSRTRLGLVYVLGLRFGPIVRLREQRGDERVARNEQDIHDGECDPYRMPGQRRCECHARHQGSQPADEPQIPVGLRDNPHESHTE